MKILVADDERILREGLKGLLSIEGYEVITARNGEEALSRFAETKPQLVLLDVMMPKMNGFITCEKLRAINREVPIIFLTAKDSEIDQVRGLGLGADDYISKTACEAVLLARIDRALKRVENIVSKERVINIGKVKVDLEKLEVIDEDKRIELTSMEADILNLLNQRRGEALTSEELFAAIYRDGYVGAKATIRVHITNLRNKLGRAGDCIVSRYRAGYYLAK